MLEQRLKVANCGTDVNCAFGMLREHLARDSLQFSSVGRSGFEPFDLLEPGMDEFAVNEAQRRLTKYFRKREAIATLELRWRYTF